MTSRTKRRLLIVLVVAVGIAAAVGPMLALRLTREGPPPPVAPSETNAVE